MRLITKLDDNDVFVHRSRRLKKLKSYLVGKELGRGSYAIVKEGVDINNLSRVAIKIFALNVLRKVGSEYYIEKEVHIMKNLKHPNIVHFVEDFTMEDKDKYYIVMEYCDGGTLKGLIETSPNHRLSYKQSQKIFKGLINAINYLQEKSIVHRDIKPDNIMLTSDGEVKLADFSVAIILDKVNGIKSLLDRTVVPGMQSKGAPAYQAPECHVSGYHILTSNHPMKLDIWSAGIILYLMAIGKFPFSGSNVVSLFENISKGKFDIPDWVDNTLRTLLIGTININPESRFCLDDIKKHPWMKMKFKKDNTIIVEQIDSILGKDKISLMNTVTKYNSNSHSKSRSENDSELDSGSNLDSADDECISESNEESTSLSNNEDISGSSKNRCILM